MMIPISLSGKAFGGEERRMKLRAAKGLENYQRQQEILAMRPKFPKLESILGGYPTQDSIEHREEDEGVLRMEVKLSCRPTNLTVHTKFGATYLQEARAIPPEFKAGFQKVDCGGRMCHRLIDLHLNASIVVVPSAQNSPVWQGGDACWNDWMVEKMGRGRLSVPERIYWTYMHEMDHFQAFYDYWQFLAKHIFEAVNTIYAEAGDCDRKIKEIQYNIAENFLVATARSFAFDQYPRGLPMSGGRYSKFPFAPEEEFVWRKFSEWTPDLLKGITLAPKFDPIGKRINEIKGNDSIQVLVDSLVSSGCKPQDMRQFMSEKQ